MIPSPRKPAIQRPSGVPLPEVSRVPPADARRSPGVGGKGLVISLGFHLGAALVACAIVLNSRGSGERGGEAASGDGPEFEMSAPRESHFEKSRQPTATARPARFQVSARSPVAILPGFSPVLEMPATEKGQALSSLQPVSMSGTAGSRQGSASGTSKSSGTSDAASGSGNGRVQKRSNPIPPPALIKAPPPRYPPTAKASGITGKSAVLIRVRSDGSAASTSLYHSSGNADLDQAAVTAARGWKFSATPALGGSETISVVVHVTFSL